jgi:glycosyltransferase involved in cell wall biosynthesis
MERITLRASLIEPGGRGGVFQHVLALATYLESKGVSVTIHTARDLEIPYIDSVRICCCFQWNSRKGGFVSKSHFLLLFLIRTLPHLLWSSRKSIVNIQGLFRYNLYFSYFLLLKIFRRSIIFTPHNLFLRYEDTGLNRAILNFTLRKSNSVTVFNDGDNALASVLNKKCFKVPLLQYVPKLPEEQLENWSKKMNNPRPKLMLLGQIRHDKGVLDAIMVAKELRKECDLYIVGEDKGAVSDGMNLANELGVEVNWIVEYLPINDFIACLLQADLLIFPYKIASQSGVMSIANSLKVPTLAFPVGGLVEYASYLSKESTAISMVDAIKSIASQGYRFPGSEDLPNKNWLSVFEKLS